MKTSKITHILNVKKREGKNGDIFYYSLKLENDETISLGKRKENAFTVGQEVSYTETIDVNGKKKRSEPKKAYGGGAGISNRQIAAIGAAILTAGGKSDFKTSADTILNWLEA